jgi:hypothetical protein
MHILFSTIYTLQEKQLNPRNYPRHEFIVNIFVWTTDNYMDMHPKIQSIFKYTDL